MENHSIVKELSKSFDFDESNKMAGSPSLRLPLLLGVMAMLISVGGLCVWSWVATIASAVIVPGIVVVDSGRKYVQHLDGGVLKSIDVQEGQNVVTKQLLIRLDPEFLDIERESLVRLLAINVGTQARLRAEQNGRDEIEFPASLEGVSKSIWKEVQQEQTELFRARCSSLLSKVEILRSDAEEAMAASQGVHEQVKAQRIRLALTEQELAVAASLARNGDGTRQRVIEISRVLAELQSELSGLLSREIDIRQTSEHDRLDAIQQRDAFVEASSADLQQATRENAEILLKLKTIIQQRSGLEVRAPVSGRVVNLAVHTVGGVIGAGATILEIVPETDVLVVDAEVRPDDIEDVEVGLPVDIRLTGIKGQQLPRLVGVVTRVSADRIEDPRRERSFFRVRTEVSKAALIQFGLHELKPGIGVTVMIRKGELSPIKYLVSPLIDFFSRALK